MPIGGRDACDFEDIRTIDGDASNTNPFLQNLKPDDELYTTAGVEFAGFPAEEHVDVGIGGCGLALELDNVADILEFGFGKITLFATESAEDEATFCFPADFDQPTGRFGHAPDDDGQCDQGDDLECNGESPNE